MPTFGIPCPTPDPQAAIDMQTAITDYVNCLLTQIITPLNETVDGTTTLINTLTTILGSPITQGSSAWTDIVSQLQALIASQPSSGTTNTVNIGPITENTYEESTASEATAVAAAQANAVSSATATSQATSISGSQTASGTAAGPLSNIDVLGYSDTDDGDNPIAFGPIVNSPEAVVNVGGIGAAFTCPPQPLGWTRSMGIIGTPEWCAGIEVLLDWIDGVGTMVLQQIDAATNPDTLVNAIRKLYPLATDTSYLADVERSLLDLLTQAVSFAGYWSNTLKIAVECVATYSTTLLPIDRQGAYIGLIVVQNVIGWIKESRVGSQTYLGVTVTTNLTLPQLEEYILIVLRYLCPIEIPGTAEVAELWRRGYIGIDQRDCLLRLNGCNPTLWEPIIIGSGEILSPKEAIQWARRNQLPNDDQVAAVMRTGVSDQVIAQQIVDLYDELPSINDHLHWLQRNVFDADYVERYQLLEGFTTRFWAAFGSDLTSLGYTQQRASYEYAAHWIMPSPTQMQDFVYRLRPGRNTDGVVFTTDDYARILAEQDYAPLARQWFAATVYRLPTQQQLKNQLAEQVITVDDVQEGLQDLGYSQTDAANLAGVVNLEARRQRVAAAKGWTTDALSSAYAAGLVTAAQVYVSMDYLGYSQVEAANLMAVSQAKFQSSIIQRSRSRLMSSIASEVRQALRVGVMDVQGATTALTSIGFDAARASGIAAAEDASSNVAIVQQAIRRLKTSYLNGDIDISHATTALASLGVTSTSVSRYVTTWTLIQTPKRKRRTASQIVTDTADGLLTMPQASAMWANLGYSTTDIELFQQDVARKLITVAAPLLGRIPILPGSVLKTTTQVGSEYIQVPKTLVAELMKQEPPAKLATWLADGTITAAYMRDRLALYGWAPEAIDIWVADGTGGSASTTTTTGS